MGVSWKVGEPLVDRIKWIIEHTVWIQTYDHIFNTDTNSSESLGTYKEC